MFDVPDTCPVCGKPRESRFHPFCSRRCAQIDLGRWLKGRYMIPGTSAEGGTSQKPDDDESSEK
jgi:uncharacterized protein